METPTENLQKNNWSTPIAIIIAGLLIAGAIFYRDPKPVDNIAKKPTDHIPTIVKEIGLDKKQFDSCMDEKALMAKVNQDFDNGLASGAQGTPFIIILGPNGEKVNVGGAAPIENFELIIENIKAGTSAQTDQTDPKLANLRPIDKNRDHIWGDPSAPIQIIEYSDIECPFCAKVHPTLKSIVEKYNGEVMWVYRHFPLNIHQYAEELALATECAASLGGNDAFWQTLDGLFERIF